MPDALPIADAVRRALRDFGISPAKLTAVASRHNDVFRVAGKKPLALRLQGQGLNDRQATAQLAWLQSLAAESAIAVPTPLRTTDDRPFTHVTVHGVRRRAVLLTWLPGTPATTPTDEVYQSAAGLIARMHEHSQTATRTWKLPARKLDADWLFAERFFVHAPAARKHLAGGRRGIVRRAERTVTDAMTTLGTDPRRYGLIHADLNLDNIVFNRGKPSPIDFDEFGRGWYLFDLAELVRTSITPSNWRQRKQLALDFYQQARVLDAVEIASFDAFVMATFFQYLNWAFQHARHDDDLKWVGFCLDVITNVVHGAK